MQEFLINLYEKDKFYRAAADAARRAVLDSSPLPLPKGKEKKFQNFILTLIHLLLMIIN